MVISLIDENEYQYKKAPSKNYGAFAIIISLAPTGAPLWDCVSVAVLSGTSHCAGGGLDGAAVRATPHILGQCQNVGSRSRAQRRVDLRHPRTCVGAPLSRSTFRPRTGYLRSQPPSASKPQVKMPIIISTLSRLLLFNRISEPAKLLSKGKIFAVAVGKKVCLIQAQPALVVQKFPRGING